MMFTVLTCTAREEPRFDWLADSLCLQDKAIEFEWIVVDARLWYDEARRREVLAAAARGRIPRILHLPPKPCRWQGPQRWTRSDRYALSNARNTGLTVASGDHVILADDCAVLDPEWLARHARWADGRYGVAGTFCTYQTAHVQDGRILSGDMGQYGWDPRRAEAADPKPAMIGWGYGLNTSFPLAAALSVNGWDEMYDGQAGSDDCDFSIRAERAGTSYMYDPHCIVYPVLETHGEVFGHNGWGMQERSVRRPKELILRADGIPHFANEALIERLLRDEPNRVHPAATWFDLASARRVYQASGSVEPHDLGPSTDWIDGQALADMA